MRFTNDGIFDTETCEAYSATKAWTLTGGDGPKTVYAAVPGRGRNVLARQRHDHARHRRPDRHVTINGGAAYATSPNVTLDSDGGRRDRDALHQRRRLRHRDLRGLLGDQVLDARGADGAKTVYAEYRDAAGNVLATSDTITLDTAGPEAASISIKAARRTRPVAATVTP